MSLSGYTVKLRTNSQYTNAKLKLLNFAQLEFKVLTVYRAVNRVLCQLLLRYKTLSCLEPAK